MQRSLGWGGMNSRLYFQDNGSEVGCSALIGRSGTATARRTHKDSWSFCKESSRGTNNEKSRKTYCQKKSLWFRIDWLNDISMLSSWMQKDLNLQHRLSSTLPTSSLHPLISLHTPSGAWSCQSGSSFTRSSLYPFSVARRVTITTTALQEAGTRQKAFMKTVQDEEGIYSTFLSFIHKKNPKEVSCCIFHFVVVWTDSQRKDGLKIWNAFFMSSHVSDLKTSD